MLGTILGLLIIGVVAGFIARAVVPGRQSMSVLQTLLLGIAGSFVGGFLGRLLFGSRRQPRAAFQLDRLQHRRHHRAGGLPHDQA